MSYYTFGTAEFTLQGENKGVIERVKGRTLCSFALNDRNKNNPSTYPHYEAVAVSGTTEIMEHRAMEPIFRVTDDPAVWKWYAVLACK